MVSGACFHEVWPHCQFALHNNIIITSSWKEARKVLGLFVSHGFKRPWKEVFFPLCMKCFLAAGVDNEIFPGITFSEVSTLVIMRSVY